MSPLVKSRVFSNLFKYVRSGIGIEQACESMLSQPGVPAAEREIFQALLAGVSRGKSIAESMAGASSLERLDVEMLQASEQGGRLEEGFRYLADYYARLDKTTRKIRKGLVYPLVMLHLALVVTTFAAAMLTRVDLINETEQTLSSALWENGRWVLVGYVFLMLLVLLGWLMYRRSRHFVRAELWFNRIPMLGKARRFSALERFCAVFEMFLLSGMKMDQCFEGAGKSARSALLRMASRKGAEASRNGEEISATFLKMPQSFPNDFARGIAAAEESGNLDAEFGRWKQYFGETVSEAMEELSIWMPRLAYYFVLFVVAALIIRVGLLYGGLIQNLIDNI